MLQDAADIVTRVGVLLDDPTSSTFTSDYVMPFIDQEYAEMDVELESIGMQYVEAIARFQVPIGTTDLSSYLGLGLPLASMKYAKYVKWKLPSQTDEFFKPSALVQELDEVNQSNVGAWQCRFANGSIQITPSNSPIDLKIYYDMVSTTIFDPVQGVIRGTAHILAPRVASTICAITGDVQKRGPFLKAKYRANWNRFLTVLNMQKQQTNRSNPPIHGRRGQANPTAGGQPYV